MEEIKIIQNHLEEMASKDANFSARYNDASKSINDCMQYIIEQARKQAENNAACIHSDEVFGWAVHYYQEADVKPKNYEKKTEAKVMAAPAEPTAKKLEMKPKAQPKPKSTVGTKKAAKQVTQALELDLFA